MITLTIAPIVEGHGEVVAARTLLERTAALLNPDCMVDVLKPIRVPKSRLLNDQDELLRAIDLANLKLSGRTDSGTVLLLLDADNDAACLLGPKVTAIVDKERANVDFVFVMAVVEYETWLVAGASGLGDLLKPGFEAAIPPSPEQARSGKGWIQQFFAGPKYSETVDQVRLTARFNTERARSLCPSYDKLCRELNRRCDL